MLAVFLLYYEHLDEGFLAPCLAIHLQFHLAQELFDAAGAT